MKRPSHLSSFIAAAWFSVVVNHAHSQDSAESISEPCDQVRCYQPRSIRVTLDDGSEVTFELEVAVPIILDDVVSMFPGATVFVAGDIVDGKLSNLSVVEQSSEPRDLLQVRMWQEPGMADTFLVVTNHFHEVVKYRAAMLLPQNDDFQATSTCAVLGDGRIGYEHWPHTILQLVLVDFVFIGADLDEVSCE